MYGWKEMNCRFCGEESEVVNTLDLWHKIYICPNCGVYLYYEGLDAFSWLNSPEQKEYINFPSYLYYHHIDRETHVKKERNYIGEEKALKAHIEKEKIDTENIKYNLITYEVVRDFLPKTLQEKEKFLLADIYKKRDVVSDITEYTINQIQSAAFVIRQKDFADNYIQFKKLLLDLKDDKYIEIFNDGINQKFVKVRITTKGIKYIEKGDTKMEEKTSGVFINNGNYVNNSTLTNSTVGNGNTFSGFDYEGVKTLLQQLSEAVKQQTIDAAATISDNIEEANEYIDAKDNKHLLSRLSTISAIIQTCGAIPAVVDLGKMIQPYISQLSGLLGA